MQANGLCNPAQPGLIPVPALMLTLTSQSNDPEGSPCNSPTGFTPRCKSYVHVLVGLVAQTGMPASPKAFTSRCCSLAQPGLPLILALMRTGWCCSPTWLVMHPVLVFASASGRYERAQPSTPPDLTHMYASRYCKLICSGLLQPWFLHSPEGLHPNRSSSSSYIRSPPSHRSHTHQPDMAHLQSWQVQQPC